MWCSGQTRPSFAARYCAELSPRLRRDRSRRPPCPLRQRSHRLRRSQLGRRPSSPRRCARRNTRGQSHAGTATARRATRAHGRAPTAATLGGRASGVAGGQQGRTPVAKVRGLGHQLTPTVGCEQQLLNYGCGRAAWAPVGAFRRSAPKMPRAQDRALAAFLDRLIRLEATAESRATQRPASRKASAHCITSCQRIKCRNCLHRQRSARPWLAARARARAVTVNRREAQVPAPPRPTSPADIRRATGKPPQEPQIR